MNNLKKKGFIQIHFLQENGKRKIISISHKLKAAILKNRESHPAKQGMGVLEKTDRYPFKNGQGILENREHINNNQMKENYKNYNSKETFLNKKEKIYSKKL